MHCAYVEVEKQLDKQRLLIKSPYGKDLYETWFNIEKAIRKLDRMFNKVEKFHTRKFSDPVNHERREKRMIERKSERWNNNFTFFFGELTEEEQQYRDYYETDMIEDPEDFFQENREDVEHIVSQGGFDMKRFDFVETSLILEPHENFEDLLEHKIFKYKYRQCNDDYKTYVRR